MDTNGVVGDRANGSVAGVDGQVNGVAGDSEASAAGFLSVLAGVLGGLDWASMSARVREGWLSALTAGEGAIAASRAAGVACGASGVGAAERTAELVRATGMSGRDAAGVVRTADVLVGAPEVAEALATGSITTGHVDAIVRGLPVGHRVVAMADPAVLAAAVSEGVDDFKTGLRSWRARHDNDADGSRLASRQHARRSLSWFTTPDGMCDLRGLLAPEVGAVVTGAIQAESERLWRHEDDRGPDPGDPAVGRSVAQRNADALERICKRANSGGATGPGSVDLHVVVDHDALAAGVDAQADATVNGATCTATGGTGADTGADTGAGTGAAAGIDNSTAGASTGHAGLPTAWRCESSDGVVLAVATVRRLACDAGVIPVVMGGTSQVLDLGRRTRTVSTTQRNALIVRDGGCLFPGCDRPPSWCDAHHVIHWIEHGPSDLWNLVLLCSAHHRAVHEGGWGLTHANRHTPTDGELVFTDPNGRQLAPEPPTARHQNRSGHEPDPSRGGNPPGHEQGQLLPARKQTVQRR